MDILIQNGTIVNGNGCRKADLLIKDGVIAKIGASLQEEKAEVVNAEGMLIFPGFIDAHTHFDLHVAGTVTADDFKTGTQAAVRGGTTMVIDFGTQYHGETLQQGLENWHEKADGKCSCDYSFHMSISEWNEEVSQELDFMMEQGITSFKLYMTYPDMMVDDKAFYQILKRFKEIGGITGVHCENSGMIDAVREERIKKGEMGVDSHPITRPVQAEAEAIDRLLRIAEVVDVPVVVVHLTCKEGLRVIQEARKRGQMVYAETCPQYLLMDESLYHLPDFEGAKYVIAPPLRTKEDQKALWDALASGEIQTVSTDHCSFTTEQKKLGEHDFTKIPGGMPGVETRGVLLYTYGVEKGRISLEQMCQVLSENPAKLYGLYPQKGCIEVGSDADLVLLRSGVKDTITADDQLQNVDYAPFEGTEVTGRIETVFLRGQKVVENHQLIKENQGKFIKRKRNMLLN